MSATRVIKVEVDQVLPEGVFVLQFLHVQREPVYGTTRLTDCVYLLVEDSAPGGEGSTTPPEPAIVSAAQAKELERLRAQLVRVREWASNYVFDKTAPGHALGYTTAQQEVLALLQTGSVRS